MKKYILISIILLSIISFGQNKHKSPYTKPSIIIDNSVFDNTLEAIRVVSVDVERTLEQEEDLGYERLDTIITLSTTPKRLDSLLATSWGVTDIISLQMQNITSGAIVSFGSDYSIMTGGMKLWYGDSYFDDSFYKYVTGLKLGASASANVAIKLIYKSR